MSLELELNGNTEVCHDFLLIDSFDDDFNGVLGSDFFMHYSTKIDFEKFIFSFWINNEKICIPMRSKHEQIVSIPARCEIIKYFDIRTNEDCIILPEEISEGVFVASAAARPKLNKIPVRILNVRENDVLLKNFTPETRSLSEYEFCSFSTTDKTVDRIDAILGMLKLDHLQKTEKYSIQKICSKYSDVFYLDEDPFTTTNIYKQKISLQPSKAPVYVKPYRLPHAHKEEVNRQVNDMLKNGIIEEAKSPWSSPLLVVPKHADREGNKKWRLVLDYRLLNNCIQDDKFPLPCITDILDSLSGAVYFSHLDLSQGYYQIELEKESRQCTAFVTDKGQFQMTRLPMGLKISPSSFSRAMSIAMAGLNNSSCFIYLDDLIVFGNSLTSHNQNLVKILDRLRQVNLKLNPKKCDFLKQEILYLGHLISKEGVAPDPEKTKAILNFPVPKDANETKRFVAFANYYRKHIANFADIASPLNFLSKKGVPFRWDSRCQQAFEGLKQALMNPPVLQYPNFSETNTFILKTDASNVALGAILSNENDKPVAYASRSLNSHERNYPVIDKELLAICFAVKTFRTYLYGRKFIIYTDHRPLVYLFGMTNPSSRLTKFRLLLEEYTYEVRYLKGKTNVAADALSRITISSDELKNMSNSVCSMFAVTRQQATSVDDSSFSSTAHERLDHPGVVELLKPPKTYIEAYVTSVNDFNKNISKDNYCLENVIYLKKENAIIFKQTRSALASGASLRDLKEICEMFQLPEVIILKNDNNKILIENIFRDPKIIKNMNLRLSIIKDVRKVQGKEMRQIILNDFHILPSGGHAGMSRMYNNIKRFYFWNGLQKDVQDFVKRCDECQRYKHSRPYVEPMTITTTASSAFQRVFLDLVGPLPVDCDNNQYILTLQCELTKFVECYPINNKEAITVAKAFVQNFILRFGVPQTIVSDQGTEFMSKILKEICKILKVQQISSTSYHHQTLGSLENTHKNLGAFLRMQSDKFPDSWSSWVHFWSFAFNTTVHTETEYTPYELVFGKVCILPSQITRQVDPLYNFDSYPLELKFRLQQAQAEAKDNLIKSKLKRKIKYDAKTKTIVYKPGDKILIKNEVGTKMEALFNGPYVVIEDRAPNILIRIGHKVKEVHKNRIKPYFEK